MPVARQQIPNTHKWSNWEAVFSTQSVRQLCDATIEELLEAVFYAVCAEVLYVGQVYSLATWETVAS
jgi:hypothetical protein